MQWVRRIHHDNIDGRIAQDLIVVADNVGIGKLCAGVRARALQNFYQFEIRMEPIQIPRISPEEISIIR